MKARCSLFVAALFAVSSPASAQPSVLDTTFTLDSQNSSWVSTGVDIQTGDYVYLLSFGTVIDWGASNGRQVASHMVNSDNSWGSGMVLDPNSGVGAVFRVGTGPSKALPTHAHIMNPYSEATGELQVGYNSNYYADNSGTMTVGLIRIRGAVGGEVTDTTFKVDATSSTWTSTGLSFSDSSYVWMFAFGSAITNGVACGKRIGAFLVNSDNSYGGGMVPAPSCGAGAVFRVGGGEGQALPAIAHIMNPWSGDEGALDIAFNDNMHSDNSGTLVVGVIGVFLESGIDIPSSTTLNIGNLDVLPCPARSQVNLCYTTMRPSHVTLVIVDPQGRIIRTLVDSQTTTGRHAMVWDGTDDAGQTVPTGSYICRLRVGSSVSSQKVLRLQ
jgi:hypothetical protein